MAPLLMVRIEVTLLPRKATKLTMFYSLGLRNNRVIFRELSYIGVKPDFGHTKNIKNVSFKKRSKNISCKLAQDLFSFDCFPAVAGFFYSVYLTLNLLKKKCGKVHSMLLESHQSMDTVIYSAKNRGKSTRNYQKKKKLILCQSCLLY